MSDATAPTTFDDRTEEDVRALVRDIVIELAPNPTAGTGTEARLVEDLGFHSLALLELAFTLEDEFDLPPIDEKTAREITTMGLVENHVIRGLRVQGAL
jgi:acyl carrier protein